MSYFDALWAYLSHQDAWSYVRNACDILVVATIFYRVIRLARGTRAWQILWGLALFFVALGLSEQLHLETTYWLLQKFIYLGPLALAILFYPELRHALEELGRFHLFASRFSMLGTEEIVRVVGEVVRAAVEMSTHRTGGLVVIEREIRLDDLAGTGKRLDAEVSCELLLTVFHRGTPLHDGAVIIAGNRIVAAGCVLPLTDDPSVGLSIHTRHRAALGTSEQTDALVVVISEETGAISLAMERRLIRGLNKESLRNYLTSHLQPVGLTRQGFSLRRSSEPNILKAKLGWRPRRPAKKS